MKFCAACKFEDSNILSNECLHCLEINDVIIYSLDIDKFMELIFDEGFYENFKRNYKLVSVFGK